MVISAALERFVPRNIGQRIADYVRSKSTKISQVFRRRIPTEGAPKPLHTEPAVPDRQFHLHEAPAQAPGIKPSFHPHRNFSTETCNSSPKNILQDLDGRVRTVVVKTNGIVHPKRGFSTQSYINNWREKIKATPDMLKITQYDLYPKQLNALISLIEKEGVIVDRISLPAKGLNKEFITNLLLAIKKWQPTLPGITAENANANSYPSRVYFEADISHARGVERMMNQGHQLIGKYQMQRIPLQEDCVIDRFSNHILNMSSENSVVLTLRDDISLLIAPPIDPHTNLPDLKTLTIVPPKFYS